MNAAALNSYSKGCPVDAAAGFLEKHECLSCGKCTFGYEGAAQMEAILQDITRKKAKSDDYEKLLKLACLMRHQSMCEKGTELAETVLKLLDEEKEIFMEHISGTACRAGVCGSFVSYHILPDLCTGCGDCIDVCEDDAILGKPRFIHVISQKDCSQCGKCLDECEENAIVTAGADKPKGPLRPIPCRRR